MFRLLNKSIIILTIVCAFSLPASVQADFFSKGNKTGTILLGSGRAFNENYTIFGVGFEYFIAKGLSLGVDVEVWSGADPGITKLSPKIQYAFATQGELKPYVGAFYRQAKIDGLEDLDSTGARAGFMLTSKDDYYIGLGMVFEQYQGCSETIFVSCSDSYPELIFAISL